MNKFIMIMVGLIALVILVAIVLVSPNTKDALSNKPVIIIGENDFSKFYVSKGQKFQIELAANPTTGYTWQLDDTYDHTTLKYISNNFTPSTNNMGSPGIDVWEFEALRPGITDLQFSYSQSWDTATPPTDSKIFNINVSN